MLIIFIIMISIIKNKCIWWLNSISCKRCIIIWNIEITVFTPIRTPAISNNECTISRRTAIKFFFRIIVIPTYNRYLMIHTIIARQIIRYSIITKIGIWIKHINYNGTIFHYGFLNIIIISRRCSWNKKNILNMSYGII